MGFRSWLFVRCAQMVGYITSGHSKMVCPKVNWWMTSMNEWMNFNQTSKTLSTYKKTKKQQPQIRKLIAIDLSLYRPRRNLYVVDTFVSCHCVSNKWVRSVWFMWMGSGKYPATNKTIRIRIKDPWIWEFTATRAGLSTSDFWGTNFPAMWFQIRLFGNFEIYDWNTIIKTIYKIIR